MSINIPTPGLQIDFSFALGEIRSKYLQDALCETVGGIELDNINNELSDYVPKIHLKALAKLGLRGELVFAVPCILESNPFLIGYYRLLLGFSQKEFYSTKFGLSRFKGMESNGQVSNYNKGLLSDLCHGLINSACALVNGVGVDRINKAFLDGLTLLTLGPQLRGGANVKRGTDGIVTVFKSIYDIVCSAVMDASTSRKINILNAAGRNVAIEFAPDPDIVIREKMSVNHIRNIIAIEVKAGKDFSNIHNRMGEAEKSHQKAKANGYSECWTVVNVDNMDIEMAKKESPTTNRFYHISDLKNKTGNEYDDFKQRIVSLCGIPDH